MIKALIFDFDGTVIDTETPWFKAFRSAYQERNRELTLEKYTPCIGSGLHAFNPYEDLLSQMELPIYLDSFRESIRMRHEAFMERETLRPGVLDYLRAAKAGGLKIGLVSTSFRKTVSHYLDKLNIASYFDYICTSDDVTHVNPDPEMYMQVLSRLGVKAHEAIAIEDSPNGVKAAKRAGLYCVLVPNILTSYLEFEPPHYRLTSLADLDLGKLLESLHSLTVEPTSTGGYVQRYKLSWRLQVRGPAWRLSVKKGSRPGSIRKETRRSGVYDSCSQYGSGR